MTERVTRKLFKNGGSLAVRIPKGWLPEDAEIDIVRREDGIVEIRPLDRDTRLKAFLERMGEGPELDASAAWFPDREVAADRWDWNELSGESRD
jgi:virulence-associated protein VagC